MARRSKAVGGDVSTGELGLKEDDAALFAGCDIIIHSAAAVSFDSPLDSAVEINLLGPVRIAQTLNDRGVAPHLVAVSTCYVAGNRRGNADYTAPRANLSFTAGGERAFVTSPALAETSDPARLPALLARIERGS